MNAVAVKRWINFRLQMPMATQPILRNLFLMLAILLTAFAIIYTKDVNRQLFIKYQNMQHMQDRYNETWSKLLLEQGTLSTQMRVQKIAQTRLHMVVPSAKNIQLVVSGSVL